MAKKGKTSRRLVTVVGEESYRLGTRQVEAFVTKRGGHLGPVTFNRDKRSIRPYSVAPWAEEDLTVPVPPIIQVLRGDFFCMPFGGNEQTWRGETHPVHGETANRSWRYVTQRENADGASLHLRLETRTRPGRVNKYVFLREGHNAVYCSHVVSDLSGPMNFGHHAMLRFPEAPGSGRLSTSRFVRGQVFPGAFEDASVGGYSALKPGAVFTSLDRVELAAGGVTDLSRYPARDGYEDLATPVADDTLPFSWNAVVFPEQRTVWVALRDPRVLRQTVLWLSNGGRHYAPWSGRHRRVMGIEDVTGYFHYGLAESVEPNPLSNDGVATCRRFRARESFAVNTVMASAPVPAGFDIVAEVIPEEEGLVTLVAASGVRTRLALDTEFLNRGDFEE